MNLPPLQKCMVKAMHATKMMQLNGKTAPAVMIPARESVDIPAKVQYVQWKPVQLSVNSCQKH